MRLALALLAVGLLGSPAVRSRVWAPEGWRRLDLPAGLVPSCVLAVDVRRRGLPDVVVTDAASDDLRLLLAQGGGRFGPAVTLRTGLGPMAVAAGNLDGSGRPSLAVATRLGTLTLFEPAKPNGFAPRRDVLAGNVATDVALADVNGDGFTDAVVADPGVGAIELLLGDGRGQLRLSARVPVMPGISRLGAADLNRDGRADVVALDPAMLSISVLLGRPDGTLELRRDFPAGPPPTALALADLDGDGFVDAVVTNGGTDSFQILYGDGRGGFSAPRQLLTGLFPSAVAVGDFDLDGRPDLAIASGALNSVWLYRNLGGRRFADPVTLLTGLGPAWLSVGDLDGDGRPDLAVADARGNSLTLLLQR